MPFKLRGSFMFMKGSPVPLDDARILPDYCFIKLNCDESAIYEL